MQKFYHNKMKLSFFDNKQYTEKQNYESNTL